MKTNFFKVSSVLTVTILFLAIVIGNAFGFGLKNLTGGKKKEKVNVDALVDKQSNLCKRLYAALDDVTKAQMHFANALGDKKTLEQLKQVRESIAKGNLEANALGQATSATANVAKRQKEQFEKERKYDETKKRELTKGLVPYTTGTVHSVLLGKEFTHQLTSTKDAIQEAGISGALSVKKKLGFIIHVAPNIPKLTSSLLSTANTAIKVAKEEKLDVSEPEKKLADLVL